MNQETEVKSKRQLNGQVVSDKMQKTVTVLIARRVKHPRYGKTITRSTKIFAHNEIAEVQSGDWVTIEETRPVSKNKSWKVVRLDRKSSGHQVTAA